MLLDAKAEFVAHGALNTGGAGTYLLGNVYDQGVAGREMTGEGIFLVITVDTTATSGGAATLELQLASDSAAAIATDGSANVHFRTKAFPVAQLTTGTVLAAVRLPSEALPTMKRYLGILQVTGTAAFTAGKVNAFLTKDAARWKSYADSAN